MSRFQRIPVLLLCLGLLLATAGPARAADESLQVLMLKKLFATSTMQWREILDQNRNILDNSFFERVEKRIRWGLDNGQVEDAIRFAVVADMAGLSVKRSTNYRLEMAQMFLGLGNFQTAMDLIDNILVMDPKNQAVRFYKASVVHDSGNLVDSYVLYDTLVKEGYRKAEGLYRMALIELRREEQALARRHLEESLRLDPKNTLARQELDRLLQALSSAHIVPGDTGSSSTAPPFSGAGAAGLTPEQASRAQGFFDEAEALRSQGELVRAAELYNRSIQANPGMVKAYVYLGAVYFQMRNLEPAIRTLEQACRVGPQDAEAWRYLGYCYERRYDGSLAADDLARAREAFNKAGTLDPNNEMIKMDVQRIQARS